jgi:uroporphyrinogen decarboxylase
MNSRERVLTAVAHKEPDRVPLTVDMQHEVEVDLYRHFGITTRAELWDKLHIDTWLVGAKIADPDPGAAVPAGESKSIWGYRSREVSYGKGSYSEMVHFPLAGGDLTRQRIDAHIYPDTAQVTVDPIRTARAAPPDRAIIAHLSHGGYFNATFMRGLEQYLMDLYIDYPTAEYFVRRICEFVVPAVQKLVDEAADAFDIYYIADDYCDATRPLFSPEIFRKLVKPYLTEIATIIHKADKKFLLHVCGAVREILPDIIDAGVDILEPIQTSATGMAVEGLKRDFGKDITFYGSMDLVSVLNRCTPDEVRDVTRKHMRVLGKDGGLILGPGHTYIQVDAPLANILAMYETAYTEGGYGKKAAARKKK